MAAVKLLQELNLTDAFALKSLRTFVRIVLLEKVSLSVGDLPFIVTLVTNLIDPRSFSVMVPLLFELISLLIASLCAEQAAKSLTGIIVVHHSDSKHGRLQTQYNNDARGPSSRIVPAWRRQLALFLCVPFAVIDWIRLLLGDHCRWADKRVVGCLELCVPLDDSSPSKVRALRSLYNAAHSCPILPESSRKRAIIATALALLVIVCSPSHYTSIKALVSCGGALSAFDQSFGAEITPGRRVRSAAVVKAIAARPAAVRQYVVSMPRIDLPMELTLDVGRKLWDQMAFGMAPR